MPGLLKASPACQADLSDLKGQDTPIIFDSTCNWIDHHSNKLTKLQSMRVRMQQYQHPCIVLWCGIRAKNEKFLQRI